MPYILRDDSGQIVRISVKAIHGGDMLPHHHGEVVEFLKVRNQNPEEIEAMLAQLRVTDAEMSRATEDVIIVLLKKNIIRMSDLPREVQDRMALRVRLRSKIEETYEKASRS